MIIKIIPLKSICFSLLLIFGFSQQYPTCLHSIDTSNATNTYNNHILTLTDFILSDSSDLYNAAEQFIVNGNDQKINTIIKDKQKLYIFLTVFLSLLSLIILIVLIKIGSLQLTSKQIFQKRKQKGYSSPLSLMFLFVALLLFITTCFNAYTITTMLEDLNNTVCIIDNTNYAFIYGSPQNNWDGVNSFIDKITQANKILTSLDKTLNSSFTIDLNTTEIAQISFNSIYTQYVSIKNQFLTAQIIANLTDTSQNINLTTLIPNLFISGSTTSAILSTFQSFLGTLQSSISTFSSLQHFYNDSSPNINLTISVLSAQQIEITRQLKQFSIRYQHFRSLTRNFFSNSHKILLLCEFITVFTVISSLLSIIIMRLIQSSYDHFSLKAVKILWTAHIIAFCLNLILLIVIDQVYLFNQGICQVSTNMINNQTLIETLFPQSIGNSGLYLFSSCLFDSDFTKITETNISLFIVSAFLSLKDQMFNNYNYISLSSYGDIIQDIRQQLLAYKFGFQGSYGQISSKLSNINKITLNNIYNESCFKHHWEFTSSNCNSAENIIVKPTVPFTYNSPADYAVLPSSCYLLNDYTANSPKTINISAFFSLYGQFVKKCPNSMKALQDSARQFFSLQLARQAVIDNLINSITDLSPLFANLALILVNDTLSQTTFLKSIFANFTTAPSYQTIFSGNNCTVISSYLYATYNKLCVDFLSKTQQVYLLTACNLIYSVIIIILSLLYAFELRSFPKKEQESEQSSQQNVKFDNTSSVMLSDNHGSQSSEIHSENSSSKLSYESNQIKIEDET